MKLDYTRSAQSTLDKLSTHIRKAFYKQAGFLLHNLQHPSLRSKKYDEVEDLWQARVTKGWRFYFQIVGETTSLSELHRTRNEDNDAGVTGSDCFNSGSTIPGP